MGYTKGTIDQDHYRRVIGELKEIPQELTNLLKKEKEIPKLADELFRKNEKFFMERGRMRACPVRVR